MTDITDMGSPGCREIRQLLGVYVVGAIDPAERAIVDGHLSVCSECRAELGGLAGLPALLSRVPVADAERMVSGVEPNQDHVRRVASLLREAGAHHRGGRGRRAHAGLAADLHMVHQPERDAGGKDRVGHAGEHAAQHFGGRIAGSERGHRILIHEK